MVMQPHTRTRSTIFLGCLILIALTSSPCLAYRDKSEALAKAAKAGHTAEVESLIAQGVTPGSSLNGMTVLMWAAGCGHTDIVRLLLRKDATLHTATDGLGMNALAYAAAGGHLEAAKALLAAGSNPTIVANQKSFGGPGESFTFTAALVMFPAANGHAPVVSALLDAGVDVNSKTDTGVTPLMHAAHSGQYEAAKVLLSRGADLNAQTRCGRTALMEACTRSSVPVAQLLLENGAKVNAQATGGAHYLLLNNPNNSYHNSESLSTPLLFIYVACENPSLSEKEAYTPLMIAALRGQLELVQVLLKHGADSTYRNPSGIGAVQMAKRGLELAQRQKGGPKGQHQETIQLLIKSGGK